MKAYVVREKRKKLRYSSYLTQKLFRGKYVKKLNKKGEKKNGD